MSDWTVQRYWVRGIQMWHEPQSADNAEVVLASDYAALRAKVEALEQALQVQGRNAAQAAKEYAAQLAAMTAERDRLKEALRSIAVSTCCGNCREATLVAHSALRGEPGGG